MEREQRRLKSQNQSLQDGLQWSQGKLQFLTSPFESGVTLKNADPLFTIVYMTTVELRARMRARIKLKKIAHWTSSTGSSLAADESTSSFVSLLAAAYDFSTPSSFSHPSTDRQLREAERPWALRVCSS